MNCPNPSPFTRKLIIHADDFGQNKEMSESILSAIEQGIVTSTSLLANFAESDYALHRAREQSIDLGWHVNLTEGYPLNPPHCIPSLVQHDGSFHSLPHFLLRNFLGKIRPQDVEKELCLQIERIRAAGISPSHIDGHHHIQVLPGVREVLYKIISKQKINYIRLPREFHFSSFSRFPARFFVGLMKGSSPRFWKETGAYSVPFYGLSLGHSSGELKAWKRLLRRIKGKVAEIMVHPGVTREALSPADTRWKQRKKEWTLLHDPSWKILLKNEGFRLISFRDLTSNETL